MSIFMLIFVTLQPVSISLHYCAVGQDLRLQVENIVPVKSEALAV